MQTSAIQLLENIIREEIVLLREQDDEKIKKLKNQIKKLELEFKNATHEEQEDRINIKIEDLKQQIKDIESGEESKPTPDESWLGRPVPPPDQYTGKNGNESKVTLDSTTLNTFSYDRGDYSIKVKLAPDAFAAFGRLLNRYGNKICTDEQEKKGSFEHNMYYARRDFNRSIQSIFSFRTYKSAYNLIDWDHWKKTGKWQTIPQGKSKKVYPSAEPGTSRHGLGLAIDVSPAAARKYIIDYGEQYGWIQPLPKTDPPHFIYDPAKDKFKDAGNKTTDECP